jgi:rhodanese-related sulfurtransferase
MNTTASEAAVSGQSTMREVLAVYPGAQRALFRRYHIGGCSSCGFQPGETLEALCHRNDHLNADEVLAWLRTSHEQDAKMLMPARELAEALRSRAPVKLLDVRSRQEFEAAHIEGAVLLAHDLMQEIMSQWPRDALLVIVDHKGRAGLDAVAYFMGHGFQNARCLRGGIDAWSQEVDANVRRYELA